MIKRRVVVTGAGVLSPLGNSVDSFWENLVGGRTGIRPHPNPNIDYPVGWVDFDLPQHFTRSHLSSLDRTALFAIASATQALKHSGIDTSVPLGAEAGVLFGTGMGGATTTEQAYARFFGVTAERKIVLTIPAAMNHAAASQIALTFGVQGECQTYSTACSSSSVAIGEAFRRIRDGYLNVALAGGVDCLLLPGVLDSWDTLRVLCADPVEEPGSGCRPFSADRNGFAIGEGCAVFVLEALESALQRGANPLCEIVGYGVSNDASHITKPNALGQERAIQKALLDASLDAGQIGYINAHGTATRAGDIAETQAIKAVFGFRSAEIPVSATKSAHGHLMGATGGVEFLATALALREQCVPPTTHWRERDAECDLDYVPGLGRAVTSLKFAMTNSFAFGGNNVVLVAKRWENEAL